MVLSHGFTWTTKRSFQEVVRHDHLTHLPTHAVIVDSGVVRGVCVTSFLDDPHLACPEEGQEHSDVDGVAVINPRVRCGQNTATTSPHSSCLSRYEPAAAFASVTPTEGLADIKFENSGSTTSRSGRRRLFITYDTGEHAEHFGTNVIRVNELGLEEPIPVS